MKPDLAINLLDHADHAVQAARAAGADEAEAFISRTSSSTVTLQKNDIKGASTEDETTVGIRVLVNKSLGFATVNDPTQIARACQEAVALARVSPADPHNGFADPRPIGGIEGFRDPLLQDLDIAALVDVSAEFLRSIRERDQRVSVDSGSVAVDLVSRAIASSRGVRASEDHAYAGGSVFGMAVDGAEVGSFDYDGDTVRHGEDLRTALRAAAERFVIKTLGALKSHPGESFNGTVILSPEVVGEFILGNLTAVLSGKAVRLGRSPFAKRLGELVASPSFTLTDDARDPALVGSVAFDREGQPTVRREIVTAGTLRSFLYDSYEARVAGQPDAAGNARGSGASQPVIGPWNLTIPAGDTPFASLCGQPARAVLVSRFSGSSNAVTGEFSGVVKGGFLLKAGARTPIKEVQISGNLYQLLKSISGISKEVRRIDGTTSVPAIRVENVAVTAG